MTEDILSGQETVWPGPTYCVLRGALQITFPGGEFHRWDSAGKAEAQRGGGPWVRPRCTSLQTAPCPPRMGSRQTVSVAMKKPPPPLFISGLHFKLNSNSAEPGYRGLGGRTMTHCCVPMAEFENMVGTWHVWRMTSLRSLESDCLGLDSGSVTHESYRQITQPL